MKIGIVAKLWRGLKQAKANNEIATASCARLGSIGVELLERTLLSDPKYGMPKSLAKHRQKTFSQFGQDGIIAEICLRLGLTRGKFVEIGTAIEENNTSRLLLEGWSGVWVDPSLPKDAALPPGLRQVISESRLRLSREFVTASNIQECIRQDLPCDLIGIDIDYSTYHVFCALQSAAPKIFVVEYNGLLPATVNWAAEDKPTAAWDHTMNFGATLKTIAQAAPCYSLVSCELSGTDAFFVRNDLVSDKFCRPGDLEFHWEPLRLHLQGQLRYPPGDFPLRAIGSVRQ